MSKETKEDRIVKLVIDQFTEHLHDFKHLELNDSTKESDIERWCQSFLKNCLGFSASSGYQIRSQETKGNLRPDLVVYQGDTPIVVVEVKKLNFDLNKSDFRSGKIQLSEYLKSFGNVRWGILTNGYEWQLFDFRSNTTEVVIICNADIRNPNNQVDVEKKLVQELCYDFIDFMEVTYRSKEWEEFSKEASAFSPESLSKALLSNNIIRMVAKEIRGNFDHKSNLEVLADRVFQVIHLGLNDSAPGWNEAKHLEFEKYLKNQKRHLRKVKSNKKKSVVLENNKPDTIGKIEESLKEEKIA